MLLYIPNYRPIHNVVEPILTVLEGQPMLRVTLPPSCQSWRKKYARSQPRVNQERLKKKVIYWKPQPFQPKPVSVETVDPNRTRPKYRDFNLNPTHLLTLLFILHQIT